MTAPDPDCVFCRIVSGDIPADVVHSSDRVVAFRDLDPQAPTHVLLVPREQFKPGTILEMHERRAEKVQLGEVLEQDIRNVEGVQLGLRSRSFDYNKYSEQEQRCMQLHAEIDRYIQRFNPDV